MSPAPPARKRALFVSLLREFMLAALVGAPALVYVLAVNHTASWTLVLWHALLLFWLVPPCVVLLERLVGESDGSVRGLALSACLRVVALTVATALTVCVIAGLFKLSPRELVGAPLLVALLPVFLAYALIGVTLQAGALRAHASRMEASEARARQAALQARIRPHFLFNALNCIEELTHTDAEAARLAVARLARLFHAVLDASHRPTSALSEELALVDDYLGIEQIRFGDRFAYTLHVSDELRATRVPSTVLLTLAENAIKHGVEATAGSVLIRLHAKKDGQGAARIVLVSPLGKPITPRNERGSGYGLRDVHERLMLTYGANARLVHREQGGEMHVELTLRT